MNIRLNKYISLCLQFLGFSLLFFILFNANINLLIFPFAFGMLFALAWANQNVFILVISYIISGVIFIPTMEFAICLVVCIFFLIVPYFTHVLLKKNMRKWEFVLFASLSQIANVVFDFFNGSPLYFPILHIVFGLVFMFACINIFEAIIIRGFSNKLTNLEIISLFTVIAILCDGLSILNCAGFSFLKFFMSFILLLFAFCSTTLLTIMVGILGGIGTLIATNNPIFITTFVVWALFVLIFKNNYRIFMVSSLLGVDCLLGFYFVVYGNYGIIEILPILLSSLLFIVLPKKFFKDLAVIFNFSKDRIAMKNIVNRNREILHKRLGGLSEIFNEMNIIYRNMLKQTMTFEDVKKELRDEIKEKICSFCPERNHCHRSFQDNTNKVFDELITIAYEKGKTTLLDIPSYLTARCKQINPILGSINTLTNQYKKYLTMVNDVDTSKMIIADQLLGVSKIMKELSNEVESNISFDTSRENKILDELTYHNIICIDAVVFEKDIWTQMVSVVIRNEDSQKLKIVDIVSKVCGKKMAIYEMFPCSRPGYTIINLKTAPKYDCLFGVSQKTKTGSEVSGDNYSIVKLDGDKILFAISDGMGTGIKADEASEISISLIEDFYRAGFENDLILSTVNKLLNLHKEEIFSALDIAIVDQKNGLIDFIKMASPNSFILNENDCKVVETGALPMGIVETCSPLIKKNVVETKDFIVLISDGISDSFENDEMLFECIKSIKTKNPQEFSDELLKVALSKNNGYAVDDMTVIVIKILDF